MANKCRTVNALIKELEKVEEVSKNLKINNIRKRRKSKD